ncbi:MAG TPA: hydroxymethylglutaryl-CoA reductase, degradative [Aggregatilineales bacterium]|nr:hydroxymethylglutaryl-CoA reductase, degradative [Anaerolineales bacterium]HRE49676.1 hydroxymethylglutaryl-CoA reductase, degradative [Aggregatilineales bacterium]
MTQDTPRPSSRLPGFYQKSRTERAAEVAAWANLSAEEQAVLSAGLPLDQADQMIENVIGVHALPMGIATNFLVNGREHLVPMVVEEPSIVAACSFAAKLARAGSGFTVTTDEPIMIGQIQVLGVPDVDSAAAAVLANREKLIALANDPSSSIVKRGGGARAIEVRRFPNTRVGGMVIVHLLYDTRDAMGANAVNTACEALAPHIEAATGGRVGLKILSNLTDRRKATATCRIPAAELATGETEGKTVVRAIEEASAFAEVDPYRATTHNKGIMNGMDAVCLATGNDWRALEAGAHAYAAREGHYTALATWTADDQGDLRGAMTVPLAVGTVGGATRVHPTAKVAMKILGVSGARELAEVIAAVGLAQNLAAIRALATEGIQRGHMSLHARQLAAAAGAPPALVLRIVEIMLAEGNIRLDRAVALVAEFMNQGDKP